MSFERDMELKQYILNKHQIQVIRETNPMLNLFEKPFIGTEDIRQYMYCPRKLYFRYVVRAPMRQTYKMQYGAEEHEKFQKKINIASKSVQKYYDIYLSDAELGLLGLIDYFEYDGKEAFPVEIKTGNIPPSDLENPDKMQVTAQAILIEKNFDFLVKKVRVFYSKFKKIVDYPIGIEDKLKVLKLIKKINNLINSERVPGPTKEKAKCLDCECRNYCLRG
ncbi:MAG: CRISPR-associated protein Cas4 [Promethearchaeota archaeon]